MTFVSFQYAGRSDIGERKHQEDAYRIKIFEHTQLGEEANGAHVMELIAVLADGMGGMWEAALPASLRPLVSCQAIQKSSAPWTSACCSRLMPATEHMATELETDQNLQGMGCTLLGVAIDRHGVHWVSVGDSLLYLYHNGNLVKLNEDHSLAPVFDALVAKGGNDAKRGRASPQAQHATLGAYWRRNQAGGSQ